MQTSPDWAPVVTAVATGVLALAALIALLSLLAARSSLRDSRKTRHMEILFELGRRWDSVELVETRAVVDQWVANGGLRKRIEELYSIKNKEYWRMMREPDFLEDVAILHNQGVIDYEPLSESMGYLIPERWEVWSSTTLFLRQERGARVFEHFEALAKRLHDEDVHPANPGLPVSAGLTTSSPG